MKKILLALVTLFPSLALAETPVDLKIDNLGKIFNIVYNIINAAVPIIISLAVLFFLWGVLQYVVSSAEEDKAKGRNHMLWGIVGIFVMVSVWGLVNILRTTFGVTNNAVIPAPELPGQR